jgi:hypothetical protein
MCRIEEKNPSFSDLYTSSWIVLNRCSPIFHQIKNYDIAILHCKDCIDNQNRCTEKFPLWLPAQEDDGSWHLALSEFMKDVNIDWPAVKTLVRTEEYL